jgi:hypothetical protein
LHNMITVNSEPKLFCVFTDKKYLYIF